MSFSERGMLLKDAMTFCDRTQKTLLVVLLLTCLSTPLVMPFHDACYLISGVLVLLLVAEGIVASIIWATLPFEDDDGP